MKREAEGKDPRYVPALLNRRLTRAYDLFAQTFLREGELKRELVARARIEPRHRVLDLGSQSASLAACCDRAGSSSSRTSACLARHGGASSRPSCAALHRFEATLEGLLPGILCDLGFDDVAEGGGVALLFGSLSIVSGRRPD